MQKTQQFCEIPEHLLRSEDDAIEQTKRGIVSYRCKVYRALLSINSDSELAERPMVLRSGRYLANVVPQAAAR